MHAARSRGLLQAWMTPTELLFDGYSYLLMLSYLSQVELSCYAVQLEDNSPDHLS